MQYLICLSVFLYILLDLKLNTLDDNILERNIQKFKTRFIRKYPTASVTSLVND